MDQAYWDDLEARILADLPPRLPGVVPWWRPLAARAWGLGGLAAAAAVAGLLLMPSRATQTSPLGLLRAPQDEPMLDAMLAAPQPPSLSAFFVSEPARDR